MVYFPNDFSEFLTGMINSFNACSANKSIFYLFYLCFGLCFGLIFWVVFFFYCVHVAIKALSFKM